MKKQGADIRIVGTEAEIAAILTALSDKGFKWRSNEYFYPRIGQPDFYSYYVDDFEVARGLAPIKGSQVGRPDNALMASAIHNTQH